MGEQRDAVDLKAGVVVPHPVQASALAVNLDGGHPPVWWPAGYIPQLGDPVRVLLVNGTAVVLGPVIAGQRPLTGTVEGSPTSGTVPVSTSAGTLACRYVGTPPAIGALVRLDWGSTTPWVWPSTAATVPSLLPGGDPGTGPAPPPASSAGTLSVTALDSGTRSSAGGGVWDPYYGTHLTQGSYGGRSYSGAWFYGAGPQQVAGRTVAGLRIRLGARRRIGSHNAALELHLWLHTSPSRPGGDVSRIAGPHGVVLAPGAGPDWHGLPADWGQHLANNGGGIAIAGSTYGGITGVGEDPASGQLQLDWRT